MPNTFNRKKNEEDYFNNKYKRIKNNNILKVLEI